ncbi:MAG: UDP-N-acetylmuramoyl-L-alanyl-D-glutamate--2,6-diaminopimelate ligase [Anaerolineae bacterium]|jgi:UDP-N-acetylmuramoyl-L-alanyl-D-glutamate--2,6-diaminopimelate ligase
MRLYDLLGALPVILGYVGEEVELGGVCADSRRVQPGDLFVAIRGVSVDGHCFIGEAVSRGAVAVIGELSPNELGRRPNGDFTYVQVPDSREAWGWSCAAWHGFPSRDMTLVGVTGTDGKTTTVSLVHAILEAAGSRAGMVSTVKAHIPSSTPSGGSGGSLGQDGAKPAETGLHTTTPDPPEIQRFLSEMVEGGATHAVLEVTSHGLAQRRVAGCDFDVAVVTNVTHEHLDFHGSLEAYRRAKARLFERLGGSFRKLGVPKVSVLNRDDDSFGYLARIPSDRQIVYSSRQDADVTARNTVSCPDHTRFSLGMPAGQVIIETPLIGAYNVGNILAAASVGVALGLAPEVIAEGVHSLEGVPGRMEPVEAGQAFRAIVDFAHTPNAMERALKAARQIAGSDGRVILVFGSAGLRDREKRAMMGRMAGRLADVVIVTAEDPRTESLEAITAMIAEAVLEEGGQEGVDLFRILDRGDAILRACEIADPCDVVIACGKGHEKSMCFGTKEYAWDDREAMRLALRGASLDTLPTAGGTGQRSARTALGGREQSGGGAD